MLQVSRVPDRRLASRNESTLTTLYMFIFPCKVAGTDAALCLTGHHVVARSDEAVHQPKWLCHTLLHYNAQGIRISKSRHGILPDALELGHSPLEA
jgi:hypothetical protein